MMVLVLHGWVDEMGDRGMSPKSSPVFAMAAVVIPDTHRIFLSRKIELIKDTFGIPKHIALHWSDHAKTFARRQFVAEQLAEVPGVRVNFVIFEKAAIPLEAAIVEDKVKFYNYTAGIALERILLTASEWPGDDKSVQVQFGHVKGFGQHEETRQYFWMKRQRKSLVNWDLLPQEPKFVESSTNSGVQAADQYAGMLRSAVIPDELGGYEEQHLLRISHQIRRGPSGAAWGYGFKVMARPGWIDSLPWWRRD